MFINIRNDSVIIEGYVNAVERPSKRLRDRFGYFIERICAGAFDKAIKRNRNIRILLNHNPARDLGGTGSGELELYEDNIGLHARAVITDPDVIQSARRGDLVGWSFGFEDLPGGVDRLFDNETNLPLRRVRDLDLFEVSILDKSKSPAYVGTLVNVRADDSGEHVLLYGADVYPDVNITESESENKQAVEDQPAEIRADDSGAAAADDQAGNDGATAATPAAEPETPAAEPETLTSVKKFNYACYKNIIAEMKSPQIND